MNKRIKELALQAGDDQNRFAELIIKDCVECCVLVAQAAIDARDGASDAYSHGREDAASLCKTTIRKHFEGKPCEELEDAQRDLRNIHAAAKEALAQIGEGK